MLYSFLRLAQTVDGFWRATAQRRGEITQRWAFWRL